MIRDEIKDLKAKTVALKAEHAELMALLSKKKGEVQGLIDGQAKYQGTPKLLEQVNSIIKQKGQELWQINERLQELNRQALEIKAGIKKTYSRMNKLRQKAMERRIEPVKIADSPVVSEILDQALSQPKPMPMPEKPMTAVPVVEPKDIKEEKAAPAKPAKSRPTADLYQQAASESKAQDEFLKSQSSRSYGAA